MQQLPFFKLSTAKVLFFIICSLLPFGSFAKNCSPNGLLPSLHSRGGLCLFDGVTNRESVFRLMTFYVTQQSQTFCGVASSVMVLNALGVTPPFDPIFAPYQLFTQHNIFTQSAWKKLSPLQVHARGASLFEIAELLSVYPLSVKKVHAEEVSIESFREQMKKAFAEGGYIIVNYHRDSAGQKGGGHFSPLAAYNEEEDKVLILDVSRYKYLPFWVDVQQLWYGMQAIDNGSGKSRGYLILSTFNDELFQKTIF